MTSIRRALGALYDRLPYKQPVLSIVRPFRLPHSIYQHLHFAGQFDVETPGRPFHIVYYGDEIENDLFWEGLPGRRERMSMHLWMRLSQEAHVVPDVGANTRVYSLVAAARTFRGQFYIWPRRYWKDGPQGPIEPQMMARKASL